MSTLPPLEQRLKPELQAHGEDFLSKIAGTKKRPKKKASLFVFGSGGDQRDNNEAAAATNNAAAESNGNPKGPVTGHVAAGQSA